MFKIFKKTPSANAHIWLRTWTPTGVVLSRTGSRAGAQPIGLMFDGYVTQLVDDGFLDEAEDGLVLSWDNLYAALRRPEYAELNQALALPSQTVARPALRSTSSLTARDFSIAIDSWQEPTGESLDWELTGPLMLCNDRTELMKPAQWELFKDVIAFARRHADERTDLAHRMAWGRIRKLALAADARLDDFLYRSVVLTPEKLEIGLRRSENVTDDKVIEIEPLFAGAPSSWLDSFDSKSSVRDRYDIPTPEGIVQVLISPKVRTVLQEIKRLAGRRVAGSRAQAFLLNPFATLGDDAGDVIEETQFEKAREAAGLVYERFSPQVERDASGYPTKVGLLVETANADGPLSSETIWLDDEALTSFVKKLRQALDRNFQLLAWNGFDLELQGDAERDLELLQAALQRRSAPTTLVSYAEIHDLNGYSSRVDSIGVETPYFSAHIAKVKEGYGWFPENVTPMIVYQRAGTTEPVAVPTSKAAIEHLERQVATAKAAGEDKVQVEWLPQPIPLEEATKITETFKKVFKDVEDGNFSPKVPPDAKEKLAVVPRKQLVLIANIEKLEYEEIRTDALASVPLEPKVPRSIRPEHSLLPHQRAGLAWLQHLCSLQTDFQVRGAVLADDMGLGKTFQLLALMAYLVELNPNIDPMLVVAPVSLLENWAEESKKFLTDGALPLLTAYGDDLSSLRVPRAQVDQRLQSEDGLVKFLKPGWVGGAKLVLTTYETLRDLEFSFAAQKWSLMVCDEAQRIKNPAAMVTRSAKKQNVGFKIACTGTPVENTLADLWCLFDFVQPGLLGALNDFGQRYRRPIEAKTDEEKARVDELRARIAPQILRRMKAEVAKDLPQKIVVDACRRLQLSNTQRNLYAKAIDDFKKRGAPDGISPFKNHLGLLHYLRLICTDPRPHGLNVFKPELTKEYCEKAPKLAWLLAELKNIKAKSEKVIVFCEFREIQRLLQHYIEAELGFRPDIINGDTSASSSSSASRQKRIKAFQEKPGFGVIVLSPVAVGFGVNIQAANHVVHYTRTWNPAKEDQATDRAYRIGQKKDVYVYYPVVTADDFTTFDVKLDHLLTYKRSLADDMLNGSGDVGPGDFNLVDVVPDASIENLDERVTMDVALRMEWQHFECLAGVIWNKRGYSSYRTPGSNDNGIDVVALASGRGQLIQAKSSSRDGAGLSWEAVKDVVTGEAFYKRRHPGIVFEKVCLTNQFFNPQARENASLNSVELLDQVQLTALLQQHTVTMLEVEKMLYADWQHPDAP